MVAVHAYPKDVGLSKIAEDFIATVLRSIPDAREGVVMTTAPAPYRRIDCDARALIYVRMRPKKTMVRVDISGLWASVTTPGPWSELLLRASTGPALILRHFSDVPAAVAYLQACVELTRQQQRAALKAV